jgi:hypothetical protein
MGRRIEAVGDLWADLHKKPYSVTSVLEGIAPYVAAQPVPPTRCRGRW